MTRNLHEYVPLFTLYLNVENARKHFEKATGFETLSLSNFVPKTL